jgi:hypothetical protein
MLPQSPWAGEEALLVKVISCEEFPRAIRLPSTIMLVPFANLTTTPGSIVKKTSTITRTSADTT